MRRPLLNFGWGLLTSEENDYAQVLVDFGLTLLQAKTLSVMNPPIFKTARVISKAASIARPQIYRILQEIQKLGLIEERIGAPTQYKSMPMNEILTILGNRENKKLSKTIEKASKLIEKTNKKNQIDPEYAEGPSIKVITGLENIEKTFRSLYENSDKITCVGVVKPYTIQAWERFNFITFKLKENVDYRVVVGPPPHPESLRLRFPKVIGETRTVPFAIPMYVGLFDDRKALLAPYPKDNPFVAADFTLLVWDYPLWSNLLRSTLKHCGTLHEKTHRNGAQKKNADEKRNRYKLLELDEINKHTT
jgi:sugar-specific transcriptional regulator TrmB